MAPRQKPLPLPPANVPRQPVYQVWPPRVESLASLDLVLAELGRVAALQQHEAALLDAEVAALTAKTAQRLLIELPGRTPDDDYKGPIPLADWVPALEEVAQKFCDKHRDNILEDGRKSRDLNHGRFGWRDQAAALEPLPDFDEKGNKKLLKDLLGDLRKALKKLADFADGGARFVDVELKWRKKELLAAHQDDDLPLSILKKTGFTIREESEKFFLTPAANEVESQSAETPQ
jgi:hypothetical protein